MPTKEWSQIAWKPLPSPWFTLNTDGSVGADGAAAAGGVLRNEDGDVQWAYTRNLGRCSITRAELWGIIDGMEIAWNNGCRRIAIQTDSTCAVQLLQATDKHDHQHAALVLKYWEISIIHIYREGNFMADSLANEGHSLSFGLHLLDDRHPAVARWLAYKPGPYPVLV
ncbi:Putative ribonuclease H protein At1g65750 [Linum grandiflorum]